MRILRSFLDLIFPPLCLFCKQQTDFPYFCETCWQENALIDPMHRCLHCFISINEPQGVCPTCAEHPRRPFPSSALFEKEAPIRQILFWEEMAEPIGALAFYQSLRLGWTLPDLVIPILSAPSEIAHAFAAFHKCPCPHLFRRFASWEIRDHLVEEGQTIWLFDEGASREQIEKAARAIANTFPKKIYLLSLLA